MRKSTGPYKHGAQTQEWDLNIKRLIGGDIGRANTSHVAASNLLARWHSLR